MAITRKPSAPRPNIEDLINRGGSSPQTVPASEAASEAEAIAVIVRIPAKMLGDIDRSVKARKIRTPRHTWLLEAIVEKLAREESLAGTADF